jgi:hypothetical protein
MCFANTGASYALLPPFLLFLTAQIGRDNRIRTCDIRLPKPARYQTALYPGKTADLLRWFSGRNLDWPLSVWTGLYFKGAGGTIRHAPSLPPEHGSIAGWAGLAHVTPIALRQPAMFG